MSDLHSECELLIRLLERLPFPQSKQWKDGEKRQAAFALMSLDLMERSKRLAPEDRGGHNPNPFTMAADIHNTSGADEATGRPVTTQLTPARQVDILVITPLIKELMPGLLAFGIEPTKEEDDNLEGYRVYYQEVDGTAGKLTVAITTISQPRNVPSALGTVDFIDYFKPREAVIMAGIGAGVKGEVELGDVVIGDRIIDVAGGRQEVGGTRPRPETFNPLRPIILHVGYFAQSGNNRKNELLALATELRKFEFAAPETTALGNSKLDLEMGTIVSGEKLIADGSLPSYLSNLDNRIKSCDMEGSGFAQACEKRKAQWLMFRGISDYGDPDKESGWQPFAAVAAMRDVRDFLETEFRRTDQVKSMFR